MAAHPPATVDSRIADPAHGAADPAAHGGEAGGAFPPFDASLFASQLFWFALTFGALYLLLSRYVLPKIGGVLEARAGAIKGDLDQAAEKSAEAEHARAMVDAARAEVTAKLTAEQDAAEKRLADRIASAEGKVDTARRQALAEVPALAETLAREIADKIAPVKAQAPRQRVAGEA